MALAAALAAARGRGAAGLAEGITGRVIGFDLGAAARGGPIAGVAGQQQQQQQYQQQQRLLSSAEAGPARPGAQGVRWDWRYVVGAAPGRKPAIKRPARHQWHFCNPGYDAAQPLPRKILVPHAPPSAAASDDWATYRELRVEAGAMGVSGRRHRKALMRFLRLREVDWRNAFQRGLAEHTDGVKEERRLEDEAARQRAWRAYRVAVFQQALAAAGGTAPASAQAPAPAAAGGQRAPGPGPAAGG
jgi:hypothetical protein